MTDVNISPSSQEAEDAILGAIIDSPSLLDEVSPYLSDEIFYYNRSRRLYSIILEMSKNGEPIDLITISGKLSQIDSMLIKISYENPDNIMSMDILNTNLQKTGNSNDVVIKEYNDLNKYFRNKKYILLVLIITTFLILITYRLYSLDNKSNKNYISCNQCKKIINKMDKFCSFCGGNNVS